MRPIDKNFSVYYAHLDEQLVSQGQRVKKGDTLGLVGNTGNAKHTPPHLHFGIYTYNGAIDPLPFINKEIKTAPLVPDKNLENPLQLTKTQKSGAVIMAANTVLVPLAVNQKGYVCELPDGKIIQVPFASVKKMPNSSKEILAEKKTKLNNEG